MFHGEPCLVCSGTLRYHADKRPGNRKPVCVACKKKRDSEKREARREELREYHRKWREQNRESNRQKQAEYRERNRDCLREYHHQWTEQNREHCRQKAAEWRRNNPGKRRAILRRYYERHSYNIRQANKKPERYNYFKRRYQLNKSELREKQRLYRRTEPGRLAHLSGCHRRKARKNAVMVESFTAEQLSDRFTNVFNNECLYCGKTGKLTLDHIIPIANRGSHTLSNLVPACLTCNLSKSDRDVFAWYDEQPFYDGDRYDLIMDAWDKALNIKPQ